MPPHISPKEQVAGLLARLAFQVHHATRHHDPDAIHDLRVSIRRFVQGLRTFRGTFPRREVRRCRRRLRQVMKEAAEVRNRDIALEFLAGTRASLAARTEIESERAEALQTLTVSLRAMEQRRFASQWRAGLRLGANSDPADIRRPESMLPKFFRAGTKAVRVRPDPARLHRLRLRTKRLRYTLEQLGPAYGPELDRKIEQLRVLQQHLGDISDCATIAELLRGRTRVPLLARQRLAKKKEGAVAALLEYWEKTFGGEVMRGRWERYLAHPRQPLSPSRQAPEKKPASGKKATPAARAKASAAPAVVAKGRAAGAKRQSVKPPVEQAKPATAAPGRTAADRAKGRPVSARKLEAKSAEETSGEPSRPAAVARRRRPAAGSASAPGTPHRETAAVPRAVHEPSPELEAADLEEGDHAAAGASE